MGTLDTRLLARALLALALTACFYGLGAALVCLLLATPIYLAISESQPPYLWLALLFYPGVMAIVRVVLPRRRDGRSKEIRLLPAEHPELFLVLESVARDVGSTCPADVCLTLGAGASVSHRRGRFWHRPTPELYLGLAFLEVQTVSQLRSVIAHELAHFHAGDTRVGAWLYHVQLRLSRTLDDLGEQILGLHLPFVWYARLFTRVTAAVSRRQELAADAVAARLYGGRTAIAALRGSHRAQDAFASFMESELVPVLDAGFRPPIVDGFRRFVGAGGVEEALDESWAAERLRDEHASGDSHPATAARLALAEQYDYGDPCADDRSALTLVSAPESLEGELLATMASDERVRSLQPIGWEEVADRVWAARWQALLARNAEWLRGRTLAALPEACSAEAAAALGADPEPGEARRRAGTLAAAAACLALRDRGWTLITAPGEPVSVGRAGFELSPFEAVAAALAGEAASERWADACAAAGVSVVPLAPCGEPAGRVGREPDPRASSAVTLPLAVDRKSRVPTLLGLVIVGAIALPIGLFAGTAPLLFGASAAGIVFGLVIAAMVLGLFAWFCLVHVRQVLRPAVVEVRDGFVIFDYAALFKSPLVVPVSSIRSISFDPGEGPGRKNRRFPLRAASWGLVGDPDAELGWLWAKDGGSPVPMLSVLEVRPNAAFLFDPLPAAPPVRREVTHGPLKGEALSGLLVRFADPAAAEAAFAPAGVVRDLVLADGEWISARFHGEALPIDERAAA